MGIEALKHGFINYLKELNETSPKEYAVNDAEVSVFMYSSEFKDYVKEELNVSANIASMSVNDILGMDVVNGKLVDPDEVGTDSFTKTTEDETTNSESTNIFEQNGEETTISTENGMNSEQIQTGDDATGDVDAQASDALTENQTIITDILNNLFQDKTVIDALDTDESGDLGEEEIKAFLEAIQGMDGNDEDISLEDVIQSIEGLKDGTLEIESTEEAEAEIEEEKANAAEGGSSVANSSGGSHGGSSSGGSSGGSSSSGLGSNDSTSEKDVTKMSLDELNSELDTAEETEKEGQDVLSSVLDGTEDGMQSRQDAMDQAYEAYQDELEVLDKDMAEELDARKEEADAAEEKVDSKEKDITTQEGVVNDAQIAYDDAVSVRESLEGTLSSLESALSSASEEEKSSIEAQIASVKGQLEQAKIAEDNAKIALDEAEEKLEKLEEEKVILEQELSDKEQKVTEYEQEIAEKYPEIQELQTAYDQAKAERDEYKTGITDALKTDIKAAQDYQSKINAEITKRENKARENEYDVNGSYDEEEGQRLVDTAHAMLNKYGSSTGYCARGVSRTISMAYDIQMGGNGDDWDTNMDKLVEQGMFKEVTGDYPSANDLPSLPAGAIICWESTGGTNGGGAQYGHVAVADGKGGEISDHYQKNIYKSVGGRSDQYRIFVPIK